MPGNYRYGEERNRGRARRGGPDDRMRDEEDFDLQDRDRGGSSYGRDRDEEGRYGASGSWNRGRGEYGGSLGGRSSGRGYEDEERQRGGFGAGQEAFGGSRNYGDELR